MSDYCADNRHWLSTNDDSIDQLKEKIGHGCDERDAVIASVEFGQCSLDGVDRMIYFG